LKVKTTEVAATGSIKFGIAEARNDLPSSLPFSPRRREQEFLFPLPNGEGEGSFSQSYLDSAMHKVSY
jgi:hypothetical protein